MGDGQLTFVFVLMNYSTPISQGKHLHSPVFLNYIHDHTSHKQGIRIQRKGIAGAGEKQLHVNLRYATISSKQTGL